MTKLYYKIEEYKLDSTKELILGVISSIRLLENKESDYATKGLLESCKGSLKTAYNNLNKLGDNNEQ